MSLILDALARAERDRRRRAEAVPDLLTPTAPASATSARHRAWLFGLALLVVVLPVVGWFLTQDRPDAGPASGGVAVASSLEAPEERPAIVSREDGGPPGSRERMDPAVAALYASEGTVGSREAPPGARGLRPGITAPSAEAPAETPAPRRGASEGPVASGETPGEEAIDIEAVLRAARAEAAAAELLPHPAPLLASLSKRFRDAVPTLMYLRHDFNPSGNSTVLINGETLGTGARTRGVEIREILPDSVVLRFEEQDFRLKALNSWVNL